MKNYINTWNIFARLNLIKSQNIDNFLIITKPENIKRFKYFFEYQKNDLTQISNLSHLVDFLYNNSWNFITSLDLFLSQIPNIYQIENKKTITLKKWDFLEQTAIIKKLNDFWYKFKDFLEWWDYTKLWDTLKIKFLDKKETYTISFWWDTIENIFKNDEEIKKLTIWEIEKIIILESWENFNEELLEKLSKNKKFLILDNIDIEVFASKFDNYEEKISFDILKNVEKDQKNLETFDMFVENLEELKKTLSQRPPLTPPYQGGELQNPPPARGELEGGIKIFTKNPQNISNFLEYNNIEWALVFENKLTFLKSYKNPTEFVICDDILSKIFVRKRVKKSVSENLDLLLQIKPWDYVVHIEHWIWIFNQILEKEVWKIKKEYLEIEYKDNDKLFVPITEVRRISKYVWIENPKLTWLNTKEWSKKLEKASEDVQKIAEELLEIYAKRKILKWFSFILDKEKLYKFQHDFEFEYTSDQINAIEEIFEDMEKDTPMDRILVWDVWFWKTEVAFNAVYNAFLNKKQSIIISPLVVLAYEHFNKAKERFSNFWLNIEVLTRFETESQAKIILKKLESWEIDLIIWTHRLLWDKVKYKNLWLLIIDEEHKFWVQEKEEIKKMKWNIDVLSMSATPIPRSLNMALSWVKEISILSNPPSIRKWVETFVSKFDDNIIKSAWGKEFERDGQLFFIHNRVSNIENFWEYLQTIFPKKKIIITHGQLPGHELEDRILAFKRKEYDILLSSTVIENWIDFPNVNTIIINDAYKFGISQIHQLRWRVWRSDKVGYCYLLFKQEKLKEDAAKRLSTIVEYSHLWAWFELAVKDLEIRWWWDILGIKQSWMSSEIWVNLYIKMLEEKVEELKSSSPALLLEEKGEVLSWWQNFNQIKKVETSLELNIEAYLSNDLFENDLDKLNFYKEIESINSLEELNDLRQDFEKWENALSKSEENLFKILEVRIKASDYKIKSIKRLWVSYEINFVENITIEELKKFLNLDEKVYFIVNSLNKLKSSCQKFKDDEDFLNYLHTIFFGEKKKKIKLKK